MCFSLHGLAYWCVIKYDDIKLNLHGLAYWCVIKYDDIKLKHDLMKLNLMLLLNEIFFKKKQGLKLTKIAIF